MFAQGRILVSVLAGLASPIFIDSILNNSALLSLLGGALFLACWSAYRFISVFLFAFIFSSLQLAYRIDNQLPHELEGKDVLATMEIISLPEVGDRSTRFHAQVSLIDTSSIDWSGKVLLSWYHAPELHVGQQWQLTLRLRRPRGLANAQGFDYQAWLLSQNLMATGYVRQKPRQIELIGLALNRSLLVFEKLREKFYRDLFKGSELTSSALMQALLIGSKSKISSEQWQTLQATGTVHLMAISGLHVGFIAAFGFLFGRMLARMLALISGSRPFTNWIPSVICLIFALFYAGIAGFSLPTLRALIFVCLFNLAFLLGRRINPFVALMTCAILICVIDPFAFLSPGFYLSFLAVVVLFYCFCGRQPIRHTHMIRFVDFSKTQILLFIGLFIPLCLLGLPVSLVGLIANSVAIPLVTFIVVPCLFLVAFISNFGAWLFPLAKLLLHSTDRLLEWLYDFLFFISQVTFSDMRIYIGEPFLIAVLLITVLILLSPRELAWKTLIIPLFLLLALSEPRTKQGLQLHALDVGQGLAIYLEWEEGNLLYDTGARFSENFDVGSRVILPWLHTRGTLSLDYVIVSHSDNDHAGGLEGVLSQIPVNNLLLGPSLKKRSVAKPENSIENCFSGWHKTLGSMKLKVIWPQKEAWDKKNTNNSSCVVLAEYQKVKILFSGDIEKEVERILLKEGVLPKKIDILIAPHHGSQSSSTRDFIEHLQPKAVIFSSGYANRYHHPHQRVVERYRTLDAKLFRTDLQGAVSFHLDSQGRESWFMQRTHAKRPWYEPELR